jgi:hypothetical protein
VNSEGIQGSYKPSVKLKGFWEHEDKRKFPPSLRQTRRKRRKNREGLLRGNLNFSIKYKPPILVFRRGGVLKGWGH